MQELWRAHRPFILRIAGGLAAFLILMNIAVGYRSDGEVKTVEAENDLLQISEQLRARDGRHLQHEREARVVEQRGAEVLERLSLSAHAKILPPAAGDPPSTDFPKRVERDVWRPFTDRADRIHLGYPDLKSIEFDARSDLTPEEWADRYALLEVVRRVLDAGVECSLDRFRAISPGVVTTEPVPEDAELALVRIPVSIEVEGSYAEILAFAGAFQQDRRFLSIEIESIEPAKGDEQRLVASIDAVGIDLGPPRETARTSSGRRPGGWKH